jgi:hypothetical protein
MKQCLKCRTVFADENLNFCRFDGSPLVYEVALPEEAATILFTTEQLSNLFPRNLPAAPSETDSRG